MSDCQSPASAFSTTQAVGMERMSGVSVTAESMEEILQRVQDAIAPVWPLQDYVAVNPLSGLAQRRFMNGRRFLKIFCDSEILMPLAYYAYQIHRGRLGTSEIAEAIAELQQDGISGYPQWSELICDEISTYCAAHYDQGQAGWSSPRELLPLYQAWSLAAVHDRNIELLGLSGFRKFVEQLPHSPQAALAGCLRLLEVFERLWESFLLCQSQAIPGWSA